MFQVSFLHKENHIQTNFGEKKRIRNCKFSARHQKKVAFPKVLLYNFFHRKYSKMLSIQYGNTLLAQTKLKYSIDLCKRLKSTQSCVKSIEIFKLKCFHGAVDKYRQCGELLKMVLRDEFFIALVLSPFISFRKWVEHITNKIQVLWTWWKLPFKL